MQSGGYKVRRYFAYILESYDKDYPEKCAIGTKKNELFTTKGHIQVLNEYNMTTHEEKHPCKTLGLGYADFKDDEDYNTRFAEVVTKKLKEQGIKCN